MWSATTMDERIDWLERIADALEDDAETVASLESMDTGKPIGSHGTWTPNAFGGEFPIFRFLGRAAHRPDVC